MDGETVLRDAAAAYQAALGERLVGAYALGSLAHGGFSALVSDIDLGIILRDPLLPTDAEMILQVAEGERAKGHDLQTKLSVFWGTPSTLRGQEAGGRFPTLDRLDLIENGRLLAGVDDGRKGLPRPDSEELLVSQAEFALGWLAGARSPGAATSDLLASMHVAPQDAPKEIRSSDLLVGRGVRRVTKLVLFPARLLYTAVTGRIGTNDAAADHYLADPQAPSKELVAAACAWRTGAEFEEGAAAGLLGAQIVPLYLHLVDDHIPRLDALGRNDLATEFRCWRDRLSDG